MLIRYKHFIVALAAVLVSLSARSEFGGQCAIYARNMAASILISTYRSSMAPGLCAHSGTLSDCGARWIYDDWDFGFGKGALPKINSLIVLEASANVNCSTDFRGCGHVGIVKAVVDNTNGEKILTIDESNWSGNEQISYGSTYIYNQVSGTARRNQGATDLRIRGFVYLQQDSTSALGLSHFDGAGSLVDPSNGGACNAKGGYGCYRDVVRMHPNSLPSTAVFQVLRVPGQCDSVKIEGLLGASVAVKQWNEGYPGSRGNALSTVYRSVFPAQIPLSSDSAWHLISVTSLSPIPAGSIRDVLMTCQAFGVNASTNTETAPPLASRANNLDAVIPKFDSNSYWGGNGSLISFSANAFNGDTQAGYGRTQDVAKKLITLPSKSIFQIFNNSQTCKYVRLARKDGGSMFAAIQWKPWSQAGWSGMSVQLPYTLLQPEGYNIITVDSANDGTDTSVQAVCAS
jgi:hypothetical protein